MLTDLDPIIDEYTIEDSPRCLKVRCFGHAFEVSKDPEYHKDFPEIAIDHAWREIGKAIANHLRTQYEARMVRR